MISSNGKAFLLEFLLIYYLTISAIMGFWSKGVFFYYFSVLMAVISLSSVYYLVTLLFCEFYVELALIYPTFLKVLGI